jgi:hypothetical protein
VSPTPFVPSNSQYEDRLPHSEDCGCTDCTNQRFRARNPHLYGLQEKPGHTIQLRVLLLCVLIGGAVWAAGIWWAADAFAREGSVEPVRAPQSLLKAREACPDTSSISQCRGELRKAYASVDWQRKARNKAHAYTSRDVVLDAIQWASSKTGVPAWRLTAIANCESHLFWLAHNGQYLGVWQLGAQHRSDPIFSVVPWQDPYAQAIHTARFIKRHGESAWQCSSGGGLRW